MADLSALKRLPDLPACLGRGALQHLADPCQQALLATDPADAQLLERLDGSRRSGILIELRQNCG